MIYKFLDHCRLSESGLEPLSQVDHLVLWHVDLDLSILGSLPLLSALDLRSQHHWQLEKLPGLPNLLALRVAHVRGNLDLSPIAGCTSLEVLHLHGLGKTDTLPDLRHCEQLTEVSITAARHLTDLQPILNAPFLKRLELDGRFPWKPKDMEGLASHPSLRSLGWYEGVGGALYDASQALALDRQLPRYFGLSGGPP